MGTAEVPERVHKGDAESARIVWRYLGVLGVAALGESNLSIAQLTEVEDAFVEHVAAYSAFRGLTRTDWIEAGVAAEVLDRAGIKT